MDYKCPKSRWFALIIGVITFYINCMFTGYLIQSMGGDLGLGNQRVADLIIIFAPFLIPAIVFWVVLYNPKLNPRGRRYLRLVREETASARLALKKGNFDDALVCCQRIIDEAPDSEYAKDALALIYEIRGKKKKCMQDLSAIDCVIPDRSRKVADRD